MKSVIKKLKSLLEELDELKCRIWPQSLKLSISKLAFVNTGRLELNSSIIHAEYIVSTTSRYTSRFKKAKLNQKNASTSRWTSSKHYR